MARYLAIIERGYRGSVETQFADALYLVRELNRQLGGIDLVLRGLAVTYAVAAPPSVLRLADRSVDTLPDPRASLCTLISEGVGVCVEGADLNTLGLTKEDGLLPGVRYTPWEETALQWADYAQVWFL